MEYKWFSSGTIDKKKKEDLIEYAIAINIDVSILLNKKYDYNQMSQIVLGFEHGLSQDQVLTYAKLEFDWQEMEQKRVKLEDEMFIKYSLTYNEYYGSEFDELQKKQIELGFECGLSKEQISIYKNPNFDARQMKQIRIGLVHGLSKDKIKIYAKSEFDARQMIEIRYGLEHGLTLEQIKIYAKPEFGYKQMEQIFLGLKHGLPKEQILNYANTEFDWQEMEQIRLKLEDETFIKYSLTYNEYHESEFNKWQIKQIELGFECGLSVEQISIYKNHKFNAYQMQQIRRGLVNGLSIEQVLSYAKPEFSAYQMGQIEESIYLNNLKLKQKKITNNKALKIQKKQC